MERVDQVKRTYDDRVDVEFTLPELLGPRAYTVFALAAAALARGQEIAECGVADGQTAKRLAELARAFGARLHLFDVFDTCELIARNMMAAKAVQDRHATPLAAVQCTVGVDQHVVWWPGLFEDTFELFRRGAEFYGRAGDLGFIHADGDLYDSTVQVIEFADVNIRRGRGAIVFDDYGTEWSGVTEAVDQKLSAERWLTYRVVASGQLVAIRR